MSKFSRSQASSPGRWEEALPVAFSCTPICALFIKHYQMCSYWASWGNTSFSYKRITAFSFLPESLSWRYGPKPLGLSRSGANQPLCKWCHTASWHLLQEHVFRARRQQETDFSVISIVEKAPKRRDDPLRRKYSTTSSTLIMAHSRYSVNMPCMELSARLNVDETQRVIKQAYFWNRVL